MNSVRILIRNIYAMCQENNLRDLSRRRDLN